MKWCELCYLKVARPMIIIPLSTEDLTKVRIAPSPLWETVTSFGVLLHQGRHGARAVPRARRVLPGTDLSALVAAMCVAGRCPRLPNPTTRHRLPTREEIERLRTTPPEVVHEEVEAFVRVEKEQFGLLATEKEHGLLENYVGDPEGSLKRLVDELRGYHDLAIAPYWPRIQEHLEGDAAEQAGTRPRRRGGPPLRLHLR